jgi:hypothetical protein
VRRPLLPVDWPADAKPAPVPVVPARDGKSEQVGFRGDNGLVLQGGDRPLFFEANLGPALLGKAPGHWPVRSETQMTADFGNAEAVKKRSKPFNRNWVYRHPLNSRRRSKRAFIPIFSHGKACWSKDRPFRSSRNI